MKLVHPEYSFQIDFVEEHTQRTVIENPKILRELLTELILQSDGEDGSFVLSEDGKQIKIKNKIDVIIDPLSLNLNNKKIEKRLLELLEEAAISEDYYLSTQEAICKVTELIENLCEEVQYNIVIRENPEISGILKCYNPVIEDEIMTLGEKIIEYTSLMRDFCGIELFIFVNLGLFLDNEELQNISRDWMYRKVNILLVDGISLPGLEGEERKIIDQDLCEI